MKHIYTLLLTILGLAATVPMKAETTELAVKSVQGITFYSAPIYSSEGAYDFMVYFQGEDNGSGYAFPYVGIDLLMPTDKGLTAGTYSLSASTIRYVDLIRDETEYQYALLGYSMYEFSEANLVISEIGLNTFKFQFEASTTDGQNFRFETTGSGDFQEDDSNGTTEGGGGGGGSTEITPDYHYETQAPTNFTVNFTKGELDTSYYADYGLIRFILSTTEPNSDGHTYKSELYFFPASNMLETGTYPLTFDNQLNTFQASYGATPSGRDYPCYLQTRNSDDYIINDWYYVNGYISIGPDPEGNLYLAGDVVSYGGSKIHFNYGNIPAGIGAVLRNEATPTLPRKVLHNGRTLIETPPHTFDLQGIRR